MVSGSWSPAVLPAAFEIGAPVIVTVRTVAAVLNVQVALTPHEIVARSLVAPGSLSSTWIDALLALIGSLKVRLNASPTSPKLVLPTFAVTCASVIVGGVAAGIAEKLTVCGLTALLPARSLTRLADVELSC